LTNVLHLATPSYDTLVGGIAAADYQPKANRFVMLDDRAPGIRMLDLKGSSLASGDLVPVSQGSGTVERSIAASDGNIVIVRGTKLWRLGPDGTRSGDSVEIGAAAGYRTVAMAKGYIVVADSAGPTIVVKEDGSAPESVTLPSSLQQL